MSEVKVLWVVAARSGSKSVPHKNIRELDGIPLMAYRILTALHTRYQAQVWLSTDSEDYAAIGKQFGAEVPFIRPGHLSSDTASSADVILHAMAVAEATKVSFKYIGLLEPTSPFVSAMQLNAAIEALEADGVADAIVAVKESRPNTIFIQDENPYLDVVAKNVSKLQRLGRQAFSKQITPSGGYYISRWDAFLRNKTFYTAKTLAGLVDDIAAVEIDEPIDWQFAQFLVGQQITDIKKLTASDGRL